MSGALLNLFMQLEPTFRAARHDFSVEKMFGEHIDYYDRNANLTRELIIDDGKVRKVKLKVDGRTILVDMSYIYSATTGERLGHTLLWHEMTGELEAQVEVSQVVAAAADGDFSKRLDLGNKSGFVKEIATGLNRISETVDHAVRDFADVMQALADGDLTRRVTNEYRGMLGQLRTSIDETIDRLSENGRHDPDDHRRGDRRGHGNRHGGRRSGAPDGGAGFLAGPDRLHRRPSGELCEGGGVLLARSHGPGQRRPADRRDGRLDRDPGGRGDDPHRASLAEDLRHHVGHRRHRLPDQSPGAETPPSRRLGPGRRARASPS